ncbi:MAG: Hpt domain-containing protein [Spirochaetales bacterium]|nr:Hpt domain-containing protein [Spirochaetales bacterium]
MSDYSLKSLADEIEFDVEDFVPLIVLFVDTTDSNLIDISNAVKQSDKESISTNIHNIKGAAMNLGLEYISGIMDQMSLLNKNESFADIGNRVEECKVELGKLKKILGKV